MDLHPALGDRLDDFLTTEFNQFLWEGAKLEHAMLLHQTRMKDVCESIKAFMIIGCISGNIFLNSISTAVSVAVSFPLSSTGVVTWGDASFTSNPSSGETYLPTQSHIVPLNLVVSASRSISE